MVEQQSVQKPFAAGRNKFSPLEDLVRSALVRAGNFSPSRIDGEVMMMFIELANRVVEEVRRHPYWTGEDIDYYNDPTQNRPINDLVMIDGLTAHYFIQQGSDKAMVFLQLYQANLTDPLLERDIGNKKITFNIKDGGSNPAYCPPSEKQTTTTATTTTATATTTGGNASSSGSSSSSGSY